MRIFKICETCCMHLMCVRFFEICETLQSFEICHSFMYKNALCETFSIQSCIKITSIDKLFLQRPY